LTNVIKTNIACGACVRSVRYEFSGNHTSGSRNTHENALYSARKVPLITERS